MLPAAGRHRPRGAAGEGEDEAVTHSGGPRVLVVVWLTGADSGGARWLAGTGWGCDRVLDRAGLVGELGRGKRTVVAATARAGSGPAGSGRGSEMCDLLGLTGVGRGAAVPAGTEAGAGRGEWKKVGSVVCAGSVG